MVPSNTRNVSPRGMRNSWHPTGRCDASLISSSIFNNNNQQQQDAEKRSSWDGATTVSRKTAAATRKYSLPQTIGSTIPSDHAFADVILDRLDDIGLSNPADFKLRNVRRSYTTEESGELFIINEHHLSYRDQVIFDYSTTRCCDGVNTYGQTSTCSVRNGCLRIKCADKTTTTNNNNNDRRTSCINTTKHFNNSSWESFNFPLEELVRRSALQRQDEMTMHLDNRRHSSCDRGI